MGIRVKHSPSASTIGAASFQLGSDERAEAERLLQQRESEALKLREIDRANEIERMKLSDVLQTGRLNLSDKLMRGRAEQGYEQDVSMLGARDEFARQGEERRQKTTQAEYKKASEFAREVNALEAARGKTLKSGEFQSALNQVIDKYGAFISPQMMQSIIKNGGLMPDDAREPTPIDEQITQRVKEVAGGAWVMNGDKLEFQKIESTAGGLAPKDMVKLNKERQDRVLRIFGDLLKENAYSESPRSKESMMLEAENIADMVGSQADSRFNISGSAGPTPPAVQSQPSQAAPQAQGPQAQAQQQPIEVQEASFLQDRIARAKAGDKAALAELEATLGGGEDFGYVDENGKKITRKQAERLGLVDSKGLFYVDEEGRRITKSQAAKMGLI